MKSNPENSGYDPAGVAAGNVSAFLAAVPQAGVRDEEPFLKVEEEDRLIFALATGLGVFTDEQLNDLIVWVKTVRIGVVMIEFLLEGTCVVAGFTDDRRPIVGLASAIET